MWKTVDKGKGKSIGETGNSKYTLNALDKEIKEAEERVKVAKDVVEFLRTKRRRLTKN